MKENIGDRIKRLRKSKKISAVELAKSIGKSKATIYRYENGEIEKVPYTVLEPISKVLEVTPAYLMGVEDSEPNKMLLDYWNHLANESHLNEMIQVYQIIHEAFGEAMAKFINDFLTLNLKDELLDEILSYSKYLSETSK